MSNRSISSQTLARIAILSALCVAFRQVFAFLPNVQPITAIFFLLVLYESLPFALCVMAITMVTSSFFLGVGPWVPFQLASFTVILVIWKLLYRFLPQRGRLFLVLLLAFAYGILIDSVFAQLYHLPWWTYAILNALTYNLAHALSTLCFYPLLDSIFRRFWKNETIF